MRVALVGIGRMGRAIEDVARTRGHEIVARIGRGDDVARVARAARAEVAFEFTNPDQAGANVAQLVELGVPTVSGTTGWDPGPALARADVLGTPCLVAPNFSIGMAVTNSLAARAARAGDDEEARFVQYALVARRVEVDVLQQGGVRGQGPADLRERCGAGGALFASDAHLARFTGTGVPGGAAPAAKIIEDGAVRGVPGIERRAAQRMIEGPHATSGECA